MQNVHNELVTQCRMNNQLFDIPLVTNQAEYVLDPSILRVWEGRLITDDVSQPTTLTQDSQRWIDVRPARTMGRPNKMYRSADSNSVSLIAVDPPPSTASLVVSSATATTPIVVGFTAPHGLQTGSALFLADLAGIIGANGNWDTITVIDPNHVSLDGSVGSGAYTSGGIGATAANPFLRIKATAVQALLDDDTMLLPSAIKNDQAYVSGIWKYHTAVRHSEDNSEHVVAYAREYAMLFNSITKTMADVVAKSSPNIRRRGRRY